MRCSALILLVAVWAGGDDLGAQVTSAETAERGRSAGVTLLLDEGSPTDRALATAVSELLPREGIAAILRGPESWTPSVLRTVDEAPASVILAVGSGPARAALAGTRRAPLLLCGRLDPGLELPSGEAAGEGRISVFALPGMEAALPGALERFLPGVRRLGLITKHERWPLSEAAARRLTIVGIHPADREASDLIAELAPRADALLILDEPGVLSSGEAFLREAEAAGMPVITDAPWLARSGAAVGILPRLDLWAVLIASQLKEISGGGAPRRRPRPAPAPRFEIDVGALDRLGMLPEPARLATAQVLRGTVREASR